MGIARNMGTAITLLLVAQLSRDAVWCQVSVEVPPYCPSMCLENYFFDTSTRECLPCRNICDLRDDTRSMMCSHHCPGYTPRVAKTAATTTEPSPKQLPTVYDTEIIILTVVLVLFIVCVLMVVVLVLALYNFFCGVQNLAKHSEAEAGKPLPSSTDVRKHSSARLMEKTWKLLSSAQNQTEVHEGDIEAQKRRVWPPEDDVQWDCETNGSQRAKAQKNSVSSPQYDAQSDQEPSGSQTTDAQESAAEEIVWSAHTDAQPYREPNGSQRIEAHEGGVGSPHDNAQLDQEPGASQSTEAVRVKAQYTEEDETNNLPNTSLDPNHINGSGLNTDVNENTDHSVAPCTTPGHSQQWKPQGVCQNKQQALCLTSEYTTGPAKSSMQQEAAGSLAGNRSYSKSVSLNVPRDSSAHDVTEDEEMCGLANKDPYDDIDAAVDQTSLSRRSHSNAASTQQHQSSFSNIVINNHSIPACISDRLPLLENEPPQMARAHSLFGRAHSSLGLGAYSAEAAEREEEEHLIQAYQPQSGNHYDGLDDQRLRHVQAAAQGPEDDYLEGAVGGIVGNLDATHNEQLQGNNGGNVSLPGDVSPRSYESDSGAGSIIDPAFRDRSGFHELHYENNYIYDQLQDIPWVRGYHSRGRSINVYADLDNADADELHQELVEILHQPWNKFRIKPYYISQNNDRYAM